MLVVFLGGANIMGGQCLQSMLQTNNDFMIYIFLAPEACPQSVEIIGANNPNT